MTFYDIDQGVGDEFTQQAYREVMSITQDNIVEWFLNVDGTNIQEQRLAKDDSKKCIFADQNQAGADIFKDGSLIDGTPEDQGRIDSLVDWETDNCKDAVCESEGVAGAGEGSSFYTNYPCTEIRYAVD